MGCFFVRERDTIPRLETPNPYSLSLTRILSHSHPLSLSRTHAHSLTHSLTLSLPHTHPLSACRYTRASKKAVLLFLARPELEKFSLVNMQVRGFRSRVSGFGFRVHRWCLGFGVCGFRCFFLDCSSSSFSRAPSSRSFRSSTCRSPNLKSETPPAKPKIHKKSEPKLIEFRRNPNSNS